MPIALAVKRKNKEDKVNMRKGRDGKDGGWDGD